jgi:hypothetical protein
VNVTVRTYTYLNRWHVQVPEEVLHLVQQLRAQRHLVGLQLLLRRVPASVGGPYIQLMDPTPDPTPFFIAVKDVKKYFFPYFFLRTCRPQAQNLRSKKLNFWLKFCVKILFAILFVSVRSAHL